MTKTVSMRFNNEEYEDLETLVESEGYGSKTELVRELIRERWDKWARRVVKHAKKNPGEYENWEDVKKRI